MRGSLTASPRAFGPLSTGRDGGRGGSESRGFLEAPSPTRTWLALVVAIFVVLSCIDPVTAVSHAVTHCGGYVNGSHGYIQTPGFPRRFPTPISCQWLIHAPPGKKIVLYFTQYYMRESFKLTEFDSYQDADNFRGKHDLGEISFEEEVTSYTVYKPYLMLKFQVHKIGNIHLRVFDFLLDVYGFNITYEIVDDQGPVRTDACSVFKCSFLGNCLAERNFETYKCHCFPGFFGDDCQYGPYCNPDKGINMCWNGGKCRYFFGSLVNTCECLPGYYGVLCEKKQEDFGKTECDKIGCNQKCMKEEESDNYRCLCAEGYRLMEDNKTCLEKGRMRYNVRTRCALSSDDAPITADSLSAVCPNFKERISDTISTRLAPKLKEFNNFSVVNISLGEKGYFYIDVIFIGEKVDSKQARKCFYDVIHIGDVCGCRMDKDFINFHARPALHMLTLENYDEKPTLVGELLTLVCRAKGSSGLQFQWFKDGAPVYVHRTARNMWITNVPTSDGESRMSVLNIDHAHMLDEGEFTCRASDWNETKEKTVSVVVTPAPHLEVTPLVTTVLEGQTARCKCLSSDDERGDFKYHWVKGDKELRSRPGDKADGEVVEDLFPLGSRLTVRAGPHTERYTCVVSAPSGQANGTCQVTVAKVPMETRSCSAEDYQDVSWQKTAENQTDIKPCPQNNQVFATRRCTCSSDTTCTWEDPNFSKCVSPELLRVEQELTKLQLGYMVTNVTTVLRLLQGFLSGQNATSRPLTGDLQLAIEILAGCQEYLRKFPPGHSQSPGLPEIVGLASIILTRSMGASPEERKEMSMGQYILDLFSSIRRDPRVLQPQSVTAEPIRAPAIELQISRVSSSSRWDSAPLYSGPHAAVTLPLSLQANTLGPPAAPLVAPRRARRQPPKDETFTMVTAVYENLQELLNNDSLGMLQHAINSQVVSVGPSVEWDDLDATTENVSRIVDIRFEHYGHQLPPRSHNITACLHWRSPHDDEKMGDWSSGRCSVIQSQMYTTSCRCRTPGHFVAVMTSDTTKIINSIHEDLGAIPLVGCTLSLTGMVAALIVHLCFWSHMKDNLKVITLNFCVSIIALDCILMATFSRKQSQLLCRAQSLAAAICYMGALVFLTLELFHIRFSTLKSAMTLTPTKLTLAGWGPVFCFVVAIITCGQLIGYSEMDGRYCWLVLETWEFYAFIAPAIILLTVYVCLLAILIQDVTCQNHTKKEKRRYIFYMCRSLVLQAYLLLSCIMSVALVNSSAVVYQQVFAVTIAALGITFFIFHCVVMVKVRPDNLLSMKELAERYGYVFDPCLNRARSLINKNKAEIPSIESTGSFKAFLKPTDGSKLASPAEDTVPAEDMGPPPDPYVRDKRAYTGERKEQLRALLASSSESSSKESDPHEPLRRSLSSSSSGALQRGGAGDAGGSHGVETLPPNYRTISEYIASLQQRASDATTADGNKVVGSGSSDPNAPAASEPARGRSFILSDGDEPHLATQSGGGNAGSRRSVDSDRQSLKTTIPNPFPDIKASGESLALSGSSRIDLTPLAEVTDYGDLVDPAGDDSRLSRQLEPVMCYVLTEPLTNDQGTAAQNTRGSVTSKGGAKKGVPKKGQTKKGYK